ncbi:MAG: bifunctional folylpolyglutamate synthase/dihydrofolate synthase [Bacteroidetes bacterium]|nr:bifunctional folylpolyglutamate synthase/dihydrofolate synthase [Bacteroidota bacterium]
MNYQETLDWMFAQLPMFQRVGAIAFKKDLTNTLALAKHLNNPHHQFKSIHVGGTNGKGSTSHMLCSILMEAGYKVGLYTSPHLKDFRERIRINGEMITEAEVVEFIDINKDFLEQQKLSFFEMTVGMAFHHFALHQVDFAVIEVGLGGRLDSTNIINPQVSVITNIGYDHMQFLGDTLPLIAAEKAGIIKPNTPVVIGEFQEEVIAVFKEKATKLNAPLFIAEELITTDYETVLKGKYQQKNVKTVLQAIAVLQNKGIEISENNIVKGLLSVIDNTHLMGRWQVLQENPKIICDTAHNKEGLTYVLNQLKEESFYQLHIVLGMVNDKEVSKVLSLFPKNALYYFCMPNIPRGLDAKVLQQEAVNHSLVGDRYSSVENALQAAKSKALKNDLIFVGGSTFVVAELPLL